MLITNIYRLTRKFSTKISQNENDQLIKWLKMLKLNHLQNQLLKNGFNSIDLLKIAEMSDFKKMGISYSESVSILRSFGRFNGDEHVLDKIKFLFIKRPDTTISIDQIEAILDNFDKENYFAKQKLKNEKNEKNDQNLSKNDQNLTKNKENLKNKYQKIKKYFKSSLIISAIFLVIIYIFYSSSRKSALRTNFVNSLPFERDEIFELSNGLNFNYDDLLKIETILKARFKNSNNSDIFVNVNDFVDVVYDYYSSKNIKISNLSLKQYDILILFRNTKKDIKLETKLNISELMSALAIVACKSPKETISFLWKTFTNGSDPENAIADAEQLKSIFSVMIKYRHFYTDSLIKKITKFPFPEYKLKSESDLAVEILGAQMELLEMATFSKSFRDRIRYLDWRLRQKNFFPPEEILQKGSISLSDFIGLCDKFMQRGKYRRRKCFEIWYFDKD